MYSAVSVDCEMSSDTPTHCIDAYNISEGVECAHERSEDVQADTAYGRQRDGNYGRMVECLPSVKCEEHRQELNEQIHVLPFKNTDHETNWTNDANETIQVKHEKKEYPDGYDRIHESTRHWVVCPGGVLKEVKAERTSDVSEILTVEDCSENVGRKLSTHTCTYNNNTHDQDMNGKLKTDSRCGVSSTQLHDTVLNVQTATNKQLKHFAGDTCGETVVHLSKHFTCETCGKSFAQSGTLNRHKMTHAGDKPFACDTCGKAFALSAYLKNHEMTHKGIKPFPCDTCGKSFTRLGHLKEHEMTHY